MKKNAFLIFIILLVYPLKNRPYEITDNLSEHKTINEESFNNVGDFYGVYCATTDTGEVKFEIPQIDSSDLVTFHSGFSLLYSEKHEQAYWVAYELTREKTIKKVERTNRFKPDPTIETGTAHHSDYTNSGYDRGHLAPAADMSWSQQSMEESFYFSNISPQLPNFNRGIWKKLEELVRKWAKENEAIYVVTGPVLQENLPTIGANNVSVPNFYYKVILDYTEPNLKGVGFIIPNKASTKTLSYFAVTIDSVEKFTGINFFPLLSKEEEELLEKTLCIDCWSW